ncbi:ATP phosphoribosyltransferase [Owenweeksia hongkongensis DSM 17368]|uniref:ATP phosphoribosyltransferase n=1 Tax=Owenweeksia hongkongensis (strain DSM 17368 / CIP 108786 / JCM 12287 / NRRL B-23963 / UST20020801) TaxID=926562 RepID=G8R6I2_OWEHD|nr:ATP phosphoribosyltransferase [Owenweeksia hongkongensis]AEV34445.1 ATP phosphoribosyltransferase [Owenweeksia hongkongensis DSM 17368]
MSKLKLAIQKSGRLSEKSLKLLEESGIKVSNGNRKLKSEASNFPIEVLFLRDDDIPQYVAEGVAHIGIVGQNEVFEQNLNLTEAMPLGFAKCRLSLAVPREDKYTDLSYFQGKRVATSYPNILSNYFKENDITAEIEKISGSVEIAPSIGLADGICDLVSTGSTLVMNGLKEVEVVLKSEASLIVNDNLSPENQRLLNQLLFRFKAVNEAKNNKYILLNAPQQSVEKITKILPGMKSPTVLPLAESGWVSIHSVVREDDFWNIIDQLQNLGAEGILVSPIEKMIV